MIMADCVIAFYAGGNELFIEKAWVLGAGCNLPAPAWLALYAMLPASQPSVEAWTSLRTANCRAPSCGSSEITTAEHAAGGELATTLPPAASQPQQIPPKSPSVGALYPSKCPKTSPPKRSFLSSFVPNGAKKGFGFPTHRSSSVPSRTDVPDTKRPTPRSLPEERSLSASSPKAVFYRISLQPRQKPLRVIILGQSGVGKTALVVRFITRRYIGEYDPSLEKVYTFQTVIDNESVLFEILDTAGHQQDMEHQTLEANIRWAEAFILLYSVTDKCSFDECCRLKFLINYNRRRKRLYSKDAAGLDIPVLLVGNKTDQAGDRMVSAEEGRRRSREIGCVCFHEISVRESVDQVLSVFRDMCRFWRVHTKFPKLKRSASEVRTEAIISPDHSLHGLRSPWHETSSSISPMTSGSSWSESSDRSLLPEVDEDRSQDDQLPPFRGRAQTDGHLFSRPRRWKYPPPAPSSFSAVAPLPRADRRMSISMRGNNASC